MNENDADWIIAQGLLPSLGNPQPMRPGSVLGKDDRASCPDVALPPFRYICQIEAAGDLTRSGTVSYGTGTLVGRRSVLTAAHNFYIDDQRVHSIRISFGTEGDRRSPRFGAYVVDEVAIHPNYRHNTVSPFDVAVVALRPPLPGDQVRGLDYKLWKPISAQALVREKVFISGYPAERPHSTSQKQPANAVQYYHAEYVTDHSNGHLFYRVDTTAGQSGAPILAVMRDSAATEATFIVGVHTHSADELRGIPNSGVALEPAIAEFIQKKLSDFESTSFA